MHLHHVKLTDVFGNTADVFAHSPQPANGLQPSGAREHIDLPASNLSHGNLPKRLNLSMNRDGCGFGVLSRFKPALVAHLLKNPSYGEGE